MKEDMREYGLARLFAKELMEEFKIYNVCGNFERDSATEDEVTSSLLKKFEDYEMISHKTFARD